MNIGAHVRGGGKLVPSLEAGVEIGATSVQVFTQSPRMWKPSQYSSDVLANYRDAQAAHPTITHTFCHATYLINLASPDRELYERSVACLISNLSTGRGMGSSGVVLHVGSHLGAGFETVVAQIAEAFERALDSAEQAPSGVADCPILIENAAGTGATVGRSLEEIEALINACGKDERLGLCIDTQHLWASGVDYSSVDGASKLLREIDDRIGLERLRCFHLNDSKIELGGNRDRHANIDEGTIGTSGLASLVGHPQIRDLPLLLEVPGTGEGPRAEDVIAARRVVTLGIQLYDSPGSPITWPARLIVEVHAPMKVTAKKSVPKKTASKKAAPKKMTSKKSAPKETAPKKTTAQKSAPKKTASKKATAQKSAPKKVTTKKTQPKKEASKKSAPKRNGATKASAKKMATKQPSSNKAAVNRSLAKKAALKRPRTEKSSAKKSARRKSTRET